MEISPKLCSLHYIHINENSINIEKKLLNYLYFNFLIIFFIYIILFNFLLI